MLGTFSPMPTQPSQAQPFVGAPLTLLKEWFEAQSSGRQCWPGGHRSSLRIVKLKPVTLIKDCRGCRLNEHNLSPGTDCPWQDTVQGMTAAWLTYGLGSVAGGQRGCRRGKCRGCAIG